jgi:hypothetical protein
MRDLEKLAIPAPAKRRLRIGAPMTYSIELSGTGRDGKQGIDTIKGTLPSLEAAVDRAKLLGTTSTFSLGMATHYRIEDDSGLRDIQLLAGHRSIEVTQAYIEGDSQAQRQLVALL